MSSWKDDKHLVKMGNVNALMVALRRAGLAHEMRSSVADAECVVIHGSKGDVRVYFAAGLETVFNPKRAEVLGFAGEVHEAAPVAAQAPSPGEKRPCSPYCRAGGPCIACGRPTAPGWSQDG